MVRDVTTADQPIGAVHAREHDERARCRTCTITGGRRRDRGGEDHQGRDVTNSTIDGARVAGIAIGGHDVTLEGVTVNDARTGVRIERGAGNVVATGLKLSGGQDGLVTTAGTTGVVVKDLTTDGVENALSAT